MTWYIRIVMALMVLAPKQKIGERSMSVLRPRHFLMRCRIDTENGFVEFVAKVCFKQGLKNIMFQKKVKSLEQKIGPQKA